MLAGAVAQFPRFRQLPGKRHHPMVEQRHAAFEADRHCRAVELHENVVGEIGLGVEQHQ